MNAKKLLTSTLLALIALIPLAHAQRTSSLVTITPEVTSLAPGEPFTIALQLKHPLGWHSYYKNSGGIEEPPAITWKLPEGAKAGEIQWPTPTVKEAYGEKSFIYPGAPIFLIEITPPPSLTPGTTFSLSAHATWQICETSCINEEKSFSITLPVTTTPTPDPSASPLFSSARSQLPLPLSPSITVKLPPADPSSDTLQLELTGLPEAPTEFIPDQPYLRAISDGGEISKTETGHLITLQRKKTDLLDNPIPQGNAISGILIAGQALR